MLYTPYNNGNNYAGTIDTGIIYVTGSENTLHAYGWVVHMAL